MLDALLKVEAKIRSALAYEFCAAYGESQGKYLDARCYATSKGAKRVLPKLLNTLDYIANKDTSHECLAHYRRAYKNVPLWVVVNAMTFGQISKMLTALRDNEKARIAKRFGVGKPEGTLAVYPRARPLQKCLRAWRAPLLPQVPRRDSRHELARQARHREDQAGLRLRQGGCLLGSDRPSIPSARR